MYFGSTLILRLNAKMNQVWLTISILVFLVYNKEMKLSIEEIKEKITPILEKYGVTYAGVFGSVARGDARPDSDVDILVKIRNPISIFVFFKMNDELEEILGRKVDLVTENSLIRYFKPYVMLDLKPLYEVR